MSGHAPIDPRVDIGHVHLKVADLERALNFYVGILGFTLAGFGFALTAGTGTQAS